MVGSSDAWMNKGLVSPRASVVTLLAIMIVSLTFANAEQFGFAQAQTNIQTTASIRVSPNPGAFGSQIGVYLTINPPPPTSSDLFHGITVSITYPDGRIDNRGPFDSIANDSKAFSFSPTMVGSHTFVLHYYGESFPDAYVNYLPANSKSVSENIYSPQDIPTAPASTLISTDTTWTKANSPYTLTGVTAVTTGVTLTIEPGVTLNLNSYYLQINGTLYARGSSSDKITISDGQITFMPQSKSWNEQTESGNIIENAILDSTTITIGSASPKINSSSMGGLEINGGSAIISKNTFANVRISAVGSPIIVNNSFANCTLSVTGENSQENFPIVSKNIISRGGSDSRTGITVTGYAYISDNTISDCQWGIFPLFVVGFGGQAPSYPLIERNFITRNVQGIRILLFARFDTGDLSPTILNNTISENSVGLYISESNYQPTLTILNNNIQDNTDYNIFLAQGTTNNVNATYNWWGTTVASTINRTVYDSKNDFTLGTVNFVPFLAASNTQAMPDPNAPIPTPTASPSPPSLKPTIPEFTVRLVDYSYDVAATYSIDQYTGQNVTHPGYHVENKTVEIRIKNQQFVSSNGYAFLFAVQTKGHFGKDWRELYDPSDGYPTMSTSDFTVLSFSSNGGSEYYGSNSATITAPAGGQIDFQVKAMIGYFSRVPNPNSTAPPFDATIWQLNGEESAWSETQSIIIPDANSTQSPTSLVSPSPSIPELPSWMILSVLAIVTMLATISVKIKKGNR